MLLMSLPILLTAATAHADQSQNGERLFDQRCASCHVVADGVAAPKQHGFIDLTLLLTKRAEAELRGWLAKPVVPEQGKPMCGSNLVDRPEQDAMLAFLLKRSRPIAIEKAAPAHAHARGERVVRERPAAKLVAPTHRMPTRTLDHEVSR